MTEHVFISLNGERIDDGKYRLHGLPAGESFADRSNYETLEGSMLFIEGVGFAAPAFQLSQHGKRIVVEQEVEGGQARISFRDAD